MILNLGSGKRPIEGAVNLDWNADNPGVTIACNIEEGICFSDNYFSEVVAFHVLEHVHNLPKMLREIHRVCKNGAIIKIAAPHYTNPQFYDDPSHVRPLSENTIPWVCSEENSDCAMTGKFKLISNAVIGIAWSREKPTCVVAEMEVIKGGENEDNTGINVHNGNAAS